MEKQITKKSAARQNRTFRLSEYELRKLSEDAKAAGMNESRYLRELIVHGGVDVPEFEGSDILYVESEFYDEVEVYEAVKSKLDIEVDEAELPKIDVAEPEPVVAEASQEETNMISEEICCDGNESVAAELPYELVNKSHEAVDEAYTDLQNFATPAMTKEHYEILTDKEKVEWLGIAECSVQDAIQRFISKLNSIGVVYRYSDDMLDEFMRLESVAAQMKRNGKEQGGKKKEMARAL